MAGRDRVIVIAARLTRPAAERIRAHTRCLPLTSSASSAQCSHNQEGPSADKARPVLPVHHSSARHQFQRDIPKPTTGRRPTSLCHRLVSAGLLPASKSGDGKKSDPSRSVYYLRRRRSGHPPCGPARKARVTPAKGRESANRRATGTRATLAIRRGEVLEVPCSPSSRSRSGPRGWVQGFRHPVDPYRVCIPRSRASHASPAMSRSSRGNIPERPPPAGPR